MTAQELEQVWTAYWRVWPDLERAAHAAAEQAYQRGQIMYRLGKPDSDCATYNELRGWWDACQAEVEASPALDLSAMMQDDEEWAVG